MKKYKTPVIRFFIFSAIYAGFVLWLDNPWFFLGLLVILDLTITRGISSLMGKYTKYKVWLDWASAIILAIVAAAVIRLLFFEAYTIPTSSMESSLLKGDYLIVSKLAYGPRLPMTPLSFPFAQNTMPFTSSLKSYTSWIDLPYKRLKGFGPVKRGDVVVFNHPLGDTLIVNQAHQDYYTLLRQYGSEYLKTQFEIFTRPVDKRENYIKRCVGLPGDSLLIVGGQVHVNGILENEPIGLQYNYLVRTKNIRLSDNLLDSLGIHYSDRANYNIMRSEYVLPLDDELASFLRENTNVIEVNRYENKSGMLYTHVIFPHSAEHAWTEDNFGPVMVPRAGDSIILSSGNLVLYQRAILNEGNSIRIQNDSVFVNNIHKTTYIFQMNHYFVMGDNRHNSSDSRFWGFLPENHLIGKAIFTWFSVDPELGLRKGTRWNRMFRKIN